MLVRATPLHAGVFATIHAASVEPAERWSEASFAGLLAQPGVIGWLDAAGGFALARTAGDEAELLMLAVAPELRRQGRGRALLGAAETQARDDGAGVMFLEVSEVNTGACALYLAAGYAEVAKRRKYYADGSDARVLRKRLTAGGSARW